MDQTSIKDEQASLVKSKIKLLEMKNIVSEIKAVCKISA